MKQIVLILIAFLLLDTSARQQPSVTVHVVRIEGIKFIPKVLEVKVGQTVRWTNESNSSHNIIANDGTFKSEILNNKGDTFEYTFSKAGEFHYYCQPHRIMGMKGTLIVKK